MHPDAVRYDGDTDQICPEHGLREWGDGPVTAKTPEPARPPTVSERPRNLWVVTTEHVFHAPEVCEFGTERQAHSVKHSNLTGGASAFSGGEVIFLDAATVAITGSSGRYRMRGAAEMMAVERAFAESGYNVWSMGYNQDTNRPNLFGFSDLQWVAR